jgi:hypothetical protein
MPTGTAGWVRRKRAILPAASAMTLYGMGVTVPTSMKPKPHAARLSELRAVPVKAGRNTQAVLRPQA